MEEREQTIYLHDSPDIKEDFFDIHTNIAETLFNAIKNHDLQKGSFAVGLFGEWGSGKTFIIHKLKEKIKNSSPSNITFSYIDVWKYSGQPLLRSILFELDKQFRDLAQKDKKYSFFFKDGYRNDRGKSLKDLLYYDEVFESKSKLTSEEFYKALKQLFSRYKIPFIVLGLLFLLFVIFQFFPSSLQEKWWFKISNPILKGIASFGGFIGVTTIFLGILKKPLKDLGELVFFRNTVKNFTEKANFSPEQFEEIFRDMLSKIKNEKYVIVFDNIDRCEPKVAYETLSTIKTYMDVKGCFYIIPCDDEAIKKYLSSNTLNSEFSRQFAEEFIDKIFQTYIRIPNLKEIERDKYIEEQLKRIDFGGRLKESNIDGIKEILYYAYRGETPRNIKRFINDYSSYFRLALKACPELLEDISLFTTMIAIKQRWHQFEKILIEHPTFFKDYLNSKEFLEEYENMEDFDSFKSFLEHIEFYIKSFQEKPIDGYIYFKKSEPSIEIADKLRNGEFNIKLNDETLKILLKQFEKNTRDKKAFALNSFITMAHLIRKYKDSSFYRHLLLKFWKCFEMSQIDHSLAIQKLYKKEILPLIINTLNDLDIDHLQTSIEDIFINCIKKPLIEEEKVKDTDVYIDIFAVMLRSDYKFPEDKLKAIFDNWEIENEYLNSLLAIINKQEKYSYLPNQILDKLIDEVKQKPQKAIEILSYWRHDKIPQSQGYKLVEILTNRLKERNQTITGQPQLNSQWAQIKIDYDLLILIDDSFITGNNAEQFASSLLALISKIFQWGIHNQDYIKKAIDFWFETAWFAETKAKEKIDEGLKNFFVNYIAKDMWRLSYFSENLRYPERILSLSSTKSAIFNVSNEIQSLLYKKLNKEYFLNFNLLFTNKIEQKDIEILLRVAKEREIQINETKLIEFLLNKAIKEKAEISSILEYISQEFDLSKHKDQFINRNKGIIDIYKRDSAEGYKILTILKSIIPKNEFNKNFLLPLLKYLASELEATRSIEEYINISNLFDIAEEEQELKELAFRIFKECLAKDQKIEENHLGLQLLIKIGPFLNEEELNEAKNIIADNENKDEWDEEIREQLIERELLIEEEEEDDDDDDGETT